MEFCLDGFGDGGGVRPDVGLGTGAGEGEDADGCGEQGHSDQGAVSAGGTRFVEEVGSRIQRVLGWPGPTKS